MKTFSEWLVANGYDEAKLTEANRKHLEAAYKAETAPAPKAGDGSGDGSGNNAGRSVEDKLAVIEQEAQRKAAIQGVAEKYAALNDHDLEKVKNIRELCEAAKADSKTDLRAFELSMIRLDRTAAPLTFAPKSPQLTNAVIEAAVCRAGGLKTLEKDFDARTLEDSHKQFRGGIGLLEMIGLAAGQHGFRGNVKRDLRTALRMAFGHGGMGPMATVGPSTLDITGILSNIANKFVREAFNHVENTWSRIAARRSVSDFKQITTYSLTGDLQYEKVAKGGEIKHGTLGEQSYTNQADLYAKLLGIDYRDMVNDDLSVLTQASRRLGRGSGLKINDVFWTAFLADASTFWTSARGNYDDGASDSLLDLTGLANAHTLFTTQTGPADPGASAGTLLGAIPSILLVPPQLWAQAWTLTQSPELNLATSTAAATGTRSPWVGMFRLERSAYLANSAYTGYSTKAWYLLADPNDIPVIEIAFLNGNEMPTVEDGELDFDRLGIAMRGYHAFGAAKQDYRGGVKMKGEA